MAIPNKFKKLDYQPKITYHCIFKIKDIEIDPKKIQSVTIRENIFSILPKIDLIMIDDGLFTEAFPIEDGDEIFIEIGKTKDRPPIKALTFTIHDVDYQPAQSDRISQIVVRITGYLKAPNMFAPIQTRAFRKISSAECIEKIMMESGFSLNTSRFKTKTSDIMTWYQISQSNYSTIQNILDAAYMEDDNTIFVYADRTGKDFYITNLEGELKKKDKSRLIFDPVKQSNPFQQEDEEDKKLAQKENVKNIYYYNQFDYQTVRGTVNKTIGYKNSYIYNDYSGELVTKFFNYSKHTLTKFGNRNKNSLDTLIRNKVFGYFDTDNMHENYIKALIQNQVIKETFFTNPVYVYINVNDTIKLFDIIDFRLPTTVESMEDNSLKNSLNETQSGDYIVGNIMHNIGDAGFYKMVITLYRNGFNKGTILEQSDYLSIS